MPGEVESALPEGHTRLVINKLLEGRVVPFLGAGVNLCDRPKNFEWHGSDDRYLPSGWELARELARNFDYPDAGKLELDLARVSQYGDLTQGTGRHPFRPSSVKSCNPLRWVYGRDRRPTY